MKKHKFNFKTKCCRRSRSPLVHLIDRLIVSVHRSVTRQLSSLGRRRSGRARYARLRSVSFFTRVMRRQLTDTISWPVRHAKDERDLS